MSRKQQSSKSYGSQVSPLEGFRGAWIPVLALIKFILPFILVGSVWELHRDEYLYYAQGQHPAFGYLECPPLVAWLASVASLFGGGIFWVKFWPSFFGSMIVLVTAGIVKEMGGKLFAQIIAALGIIFSAYLRTNFLLQPVFLEIFFWTLSIYYLLRLINTGQTKYYYLLGLALVFSYYSKYSALFFICGLFTGILLTYHRKLLVSKHVWLAALMAAVLIVPNVYWQYVHNWPLAHHMQELRETQLQFISKADFLKEQILMLFPVALVWIAGLIWLLFQRKYRFIAIAYLTVVVLLIAGSGKGYYTLGVYPMLLAAGGVFLEKISVQKKGLQVLFVLIVLGLSLPFIFILLPLQKPDTMAATNVKYDLAGKGMLKWEDQQNHPLQQDFADMLGWKELAAKAENGYDSLMAKGYTNLWVYCSNYGQAGSLQYYARSDSFKQKVISRNGTFLLWMPRPLPFSHILLIDDEWPEKEEPVFQHFTKIVLLDSVANPLSRQLGDKVFLLENADSIAVQMVNREIDEQRKIFSR